jgi:coenzyme PQQ precursor peptide PqqA
MKLDPRTTTSVNSVSEAQWESPYILLKRRIVAWNTPTITEICIGLEIDGYLPAEF